ncbi:patatin-like phospholipase family protein [Ideonella sp.]|uniref:patatin-like phospholipase family protein n=1 Tax=Ideonella sp. TaxID=1929293 RepID=UPI002B4615FF|nr:patatin-like phospholipase family protein [Ideonella sp.]HJV70432.1 patatin-like phospholipase family protein [Ideonella sp.]
MPWLPWTRLNRRRIPLALALQGGGAHGAFTWGVLDALLARDAIDLRALSGASAGAMNAVVLAHGLAAGGRDGARAALRDFWQTLGTRLPFEWFTVGRREAPGLAPAAQVALRWSQLLSPYQFNPMGLDPLREIIEAQVDFERLRRASPVKLFVAATHAASGRLRLFREHEINADALLASACLPSLHHSVLIDGEAYWDGGYTANPPLWPLLDAGAADDLMIVLLAPPAATTGAPRSADEIRQRAQELAFTAPLMRELQWLADWRDGPPLSAWSASARERRLRRQRLHLVDGRPTLASLAGETRLIAHLPFLEHLRSLGQAAAEGWWQQHGGHLGQRSSLDLAALLNGPAA